MPACMLRMVLRACAERMLVMGSVLLGAFLNLEMGSTSICGQTGRQVAGDRLQAGVKGCTDAGCGL